MTTDAGFGLPRRFLRPLLLLAISRLDHTHGYELAEAVRSDGLTVDMAGVYRELRAMEQHDLLRSSWEPSDSGPDRRRYELTECGLDAAAQARQELAAARDLLTRALRTSAVGSS